MDYVLAKIEKTVPILILPPNHLVHHAHVALDYLHDFRADIFVVLEAEDGIMVIETEDLLLQDVD